MDNKCTSVKKLTLNRNVNDILGDVDIACVMISLLHLAQTLTNLPSLPLALNEVNGNV